MFNFYDFIIYLITFLAILVSAFLWFSGQKQEGLFVAIWVPSLIGLGIYGKIRYIIFEIKTKKIKR